VRNETRKIISTIWIPVLMVVFVLCLGCQGGTPAEAPGEDAAKSTVAIESAAPEASPSPTETEPEMPVIPEIFVRKSKKDPFMPVVGPKGKVAATAPPPVAVTPTGEKGGTETIEPLPPDIPVGEKTPTKKPTIRKIGPEEAGVEVKGILQTGSGNRAILGSASGTSYNVKAGQKVGEWTVSSITNNSVVLTGKGYKAVLPLLSDMEAPGKGEKPKSSAPEPGPKVPAPPPEEGGEEAPPPPE